MKRLRRSYGTIILMMCAFLTMGVLATAFGVAPAALGLRSAQSAPAAQPGDNLDLDAMTLTFEENFDKLDVSAWGPGTKWIAHTPWSGDFGAARFADPTKSYPFTVKDGILKIEATKDKEGDWRSGLLASMDPKGNGFAQQYGYFEMRARLPIGVGVWPAFWLIGKDRSKSTAEIDILEYYGHKPDGYSSGVHVWHRDGRHYSTFNRVEVFPEADPTQFHTYGLAIDHDWIRFYFDRRFIWRTPTQPEHQQPLYVLLNLALVEEMTQDTPDPAEMFVDYVRVYAP